MKEEVKVAIERMREHAASFRGHLAPEARAFGELISQSATRPNKGKQTRNGWIIWPRNWRN